MNQTYTPYVYICITLTQAKTQAITDCKNDTCYFIQYSIGEDQDLPAIYNQEDINK